MFEQPPGHRERYADRIRLPFYFDAQDLRQDLDAVMLEHWQEHFVRQNYDGEWSAMALRATAGETHPIRKIYSDPGATEHVDEPVLDRAPHLRAVLDGLRCRLGAVRLMRLGPGSEIKPHSDHDLAAEEGKARLHLPITTNPGVEFRLNGRPVAMAPGELWYLRLSDPHGVTNRGETDRVHLVIDAEMNDWLHAQLTQGEPG